MNIYLIGDSHFRHAKIIEYCGRPFKTVEEQDASMIRRWNSCVKNEDLVIHLGDFALHKNSAEIRDICKQLNGRKILCKGNHDRKSMHWYCNNGFDFFCDSFTLGEILFTHRPVPKTEFLLMPYRLNVHGHIHQKDSPDQFIYKNVSVEHINYTPIKLDSILGEFNIHLARKR